MLSLIALLALVGLRVIPVAHLGRDALLLPEHAIVLIDSGLDHADLEQVANQVLAQAVDLSL